MEIKKVGISVFDKPPRPAGPHPAATPAAPSAEQPGQLVTKLPPPGGMQSLLAALLREYPVAEQMEVVLQFVSWAEQWMAGMVVGVSPSDEGITLQLRDGRALLLVSPEVPYTAATQADLEGQPFIDPAYRVGQPAPRMTPATAYTLGARAPRPAK